MSEKNKFRTSKNSSTPDAPPPSAGKQTKINFSANQHQIETAAGWVLLVVGVYMLISFISFYITGNADQSIVQDLPEGTFQGPYRPKNWGGNLGAWLSDLFIQKEVGVAAFGIPFILIFGGTKLLNWKQYVHYENFLVCSLFYMIWTSSFFGYFVFLLKGENFWGSLCGNLGYSINLFLEGVIGVFGIALILLVLVLWLIFYHGYTKIDDWFFEKTGIRNPAATPLPSKENKPKKISPLTSFEEEDEDEEPAEEFPPIVNRNFSFEPLVSETPEISLSTEPEIRAKEPVLKPFDNIAFSVQGLDEASKEDSTKLEIIEKDDDPFDDDTVNEEVLKEFGLYDPTLDLGNYQFPSVDLLIDHSNEKSKVTQEELEENKTKIVKTLGNYDIGIERISATIGPTVTLYEIVPAAGVRISKIKNLEDDIALSLAALGIRIIAPMPGKGTIGIEVPNKSREMVSIKSVISSEKFQKSNFDLPIVLGKTISNEIFVTDLAKMPHLLMAGATGQGKSVGLNVILASLLYKKHPSQIKFILVDPKKVELTLYNKIERHFLATLPNAQEAIITDTKKVVYTLNSLCIEMDSRYDLLKDASVRNIKEYNGKFVQRRLNPEKGHKFMPYIVLVIDELADLMMTAGKEVEQPIARLAQLARAIGIHLIVATQRPSVNVITGLIKANFPARLSFKVTSKIDSRTILDTGGADQLVGMGDMLLSTGSDIIRLQCAFADTSEIEDVCEFIGSQRGYETAYLLPEFQGDESGTGDNDDFDPSDLDSLFDDAARVVVVAQQGSASLIQRKLKLGYNRAGRIIDQLEHYGIVGSFEGSKAREVVIKSSEELEELLRKIRGR
jgi:DNA segregation ATPase FtsK/SpoIIIE, S-DNA-T family